MANRSQPPSPKRQVRKPQDSRQGKRKRGQPDKFPRRSVSGVKRRDTQLQQHTKLQETPTEKPKQGSWLGSLVAIAIILGSGGLVIAGGWLSFQLIFNPEEVSWLQQILPGWAKLGANNQLPQTLVEIQKNVQNQGLSTGNTIATDDGAGKSFILPILKRRSVCSSDCNNVVELRVYELARGWQQKVGAEKYQLVSQLAVQGPDEAFVIAPTVDADSDNPGSGNILPLTELGKFEGNTPPPGEWFYVRGIRTQGSQAIAYGHIIHYNPERTHLQLMLTWTSTTGQNPEWRQITGDNTPELFVDQTVGLEPQFRVYQVSQSPSFADPIDLAQISLTEPQLDDEGFKDALMVARNGLWSPAAKWMDFILKQRKRSLPELAQAQIDIIRLYSQFTKAQADRTWGSPSQQVLAYLIDGRWGEALKQFEASPPDNIKEIASLLAADNGRLWNRVEAALRVNPNRPEVRAWGALILMAQHGKGHMEAWLKEQTKTDPAKLTYIQGLVQRLSGQTVNLPTPTTVTNHPSRIVGRVEAIARVNPTEWLLSDPRDTLKLDLQEVWYQVKVSAFHDGTRWLRAPFVNLNPPEPAPNGTKQPIPNSAPLLWQQLGLNTDAGIQIIVWQQDGQQQMATATVKAMQVRGGELRLLASSFDQIQPTPVNQPQPLGLTSAALQWVQSSPISLADFSEQQRVMLPLLWRELQRSGLLKVKSTPTLDQMQLQLGDWPVQVIDLTGNGKPDAVMTISGAAIAALSNSGETVENAALSLARPRTVIFADDGKVIYSDFGRGMQKFMTAIATVEDGQPPVLLVEDGNNYTLRRWNSKLQKFE